MTDSDALFLRSGDVIVAGGQGGLTWEVVEVYQQSDKRVRVRGLTTNGGKEFLRWFMANELMFVERNS